MTPEIITQKEFDDRISLHLEWLNNYRLGLPLRLTNCKLEGVELLNVSLQGIIFDQCIFSESTISKCDLSRLKFHECYFERTEFNKCDFGRSEFHSSFFVKSAISRCDFTKSIFYLCDLQDVCVFKCTFHEAMFFDSSIMNPHLAKYLRRKGGCLVNGLYFRGTCYDRI